MENRKEKRKQENFRTDEITKAYLKEMQKVTDEDKSKLIRQSIAFYANYILSEDEVNNIKMELLFNRK